MRTIPCQEEIYVQAGILQLGGESNRYREGRVSVAGAVSHIRQASYSIGEYLFTPESTTLLHQPTGEVTLIPRREADILQLLCKGGGNIIPTQNILLSLWGDDDFFNARSLQVLITRLRHRFFRNPRIRILNVRGTGYKLIVE